MKLQLKTKNDDGVGITGYNLVECNSLEEIDSKLSGVSDNECIDIQAGTILTICDLDKQPELVSKLIKKLRLGGTIGIGGVDVSVFSKCISNGTLNPKEGCAFTSGKCLSDLTFVTDMLRQMGLTTTNTTEIFGANFIISASRSN